MSFFNAEINIPSNNGKSIQLRAPDGLSSNHSFFLPSTIGASGNILAITSVNGTDNIVGFTSDLSVNSVDVSNIIANDLTVNATNINATNLNTTTVNCNNINSTNLIDASGLNANNLSLVSDSSVLSFGVDSEITLTHVADTGLILKNTNTADNSTAVLTLQTGETDIQVDDVIGAIRFQAPNEGTGGDANLICAGIEAVSEGDFSASSNATKLSFKTGSSEAATEKMTLSSGGELTLGNLNISDVKITSTATNAGLDYQPNGNGSLRLLMNSGLSQGLNNGIVFDDAFSWKILKGTKGSSTANLEFYHYNGGWAGKGYLNVTGSGQINFTGQHRNIMNKNITNTSIGLIVSSTGKFINTDNTLKASINESLPICIFSNSDNDKKVFGVLSDKEDNENTRSYSSGNWGSVYTKQNTNEQRMFINSVGEGGIWVCNKNGNIENGDYITSSTVPGYGVKQADDLLHNYTVAKITCDCDFSTTQIVKQKLKVISTTDIIQQLK
jgi:hypothetical protein